VASAAVRRLFLLALIAIGRSGLTCSAAERRGRGQRSRPFQYYDADFTVAQDAPSTRWRPSPPSSIGAARHLPYWDVAKSEQPTVPAEARDHLDPARRRPAPVPDAVEDGERFRCEDRQPRHDAAVAPMSTSSATASRASSIPAAPGENRRFATRPATRTRHRRFLERRSPSWNNEIQRVHIGRPCPPTSPARSVRSAGRRTRLHRSDRAWQHRRFSAVSLPPRTPPRCVRGRRARAAADQPGRGRTRGPILGQSVTGVAWSSACRWRRRPPTSRYRTTVEPPPVPRAVRAAPGLDPCRPSNPHRERAQERSDRTLFTSASVAGRTEAAATVARQEHRRTRSVGRLARSPWRRHALKINTTRCRVRRDNSAHSGQNSARQDRHGAAVKKGPSRTVCWPAQENVGPHGGHGPPRSSRCAASSAGFPATCGACRSRCSSPSRCARGPTVGTRRTEAGRQLCRRQADPPAIGHRPARPGSTSAPARISTAPTSVRRCGGHCRVVGEEVQDTTGAVAPQPGWYRHRRDRLACRCSAAEFRQLRIGRCHRRSGPTPHRSRPSSSSSSSGDERGGRGVAEEEGAARGEIPLIWYCDSVLILIGFGLGSTRSVRRRAGVRRCLASTLS